MIIFLYGKDTYRIKEKIKEIVLSYQKKHKSGLNLRYIDLLRDNFSIEQVCRESCQQSMFKEKKLYILSNSFSKKEELKKTLESLNNSDDIFLLYEEEVNEKDNLFKELIKISSSQQFTPLSTLNFRKWIKKEFEKLNKTISEKALIFFITSLKSDDLWRASGEIKKIACFSEKKEIKEEDVKIFLKSNIKNEIFKTIDAVARKDKKKAISLIRNHIEQGEDPLYLLSMISYQIKNVLIVKDLIERGESYQQAIKKAKMHPFVFKKAYSQSLMFSLHELKKAHGLLVETDINIKTGKVDKETGIELLLGKI